MRQCSPNNSDLDYEEHRNMHKAIMERDPEKAMKTVEQHIEAWTRNQKEDR